jgi:hypothetical protein
VGDAKAVVRSLKFNGARLDATVGMGGTRYGVTIALDNPDFVGVKEAMDTLCDRIGAVTKASLAEALDDHLSPSAKASLTG